eukprot:jgi/Mesvir1/27007/Mv20714-RA.1
MSVNTSTMSLETLIQSGVASASLSPMLNGRHSFARSNTKLLSCKPGSSIFLLRHQRCPMKISSNSKVGAAKTTSASIQYTPGSDQASGSLLGSLSSDSWWVPKLLPVSPGSVIPLVQAPVLLSACVALAAAILNWTLGVAVDPAVMSLVTPLLALLLATQAYAAYAKWQEARTALGVVVASIAEVAGKAGTYYRAGSGTKTAVQEAKTETSRLLFLTLALLVADVCPSSSTGPSADAQKVISANTSAIERSSLSATDRPTMTALKWLEAHLYNSGMGEGLFGREGKTVPIWVDISTSLRILGESVNTARSVAITRPPVALSSLTQVLTCATLFVMPFSLAPKLGLFAIPFQILISLAYFGVQAATLQMQFPCNSGANSILADSKLINNMPRYIYTQIWGDVETATLSQARPTWAAGFY